MFNSISKSLRRQRQANQAFDDVASDEIKAIRAEINEAALAKMHEAAEAAMGGEACNACELRFEAEKLRYLAINIPLDLINFQEIK